ncbi:uncharacterized protein V6R79_008846, partial [Siganus canaliculatus]
MTGAVLPSVPCTEDRVDPSSIMHSLIHYCLLFVDNLCKNLYAPSRDDEIMASSRDLHAFVVPSQKT